MIETLDYCRNVIQRAIALEEAEVKAAGGLRGWHWPTWELWAGPSTPGADLAPLGRRTAKFAELSRNSFPVLLALANTMLSEIEANISQHYTNLKHISDANLAGARGAAQKVALHDAALANLAHCQRACFVLEVLLKTWEED